MHYVCVHANKLVADCNGDSIWTNRRIAIGNAMGGSYRCPGGWRACLSSLLRKAKLARSGPREDLFEAPDRHPKEQQREQERRCFVAQNWWRFNKRNFEGRTVLVRAVGARAISGSFCSGKTRQKSNLELVKIVERTTLAWGRTNQPWLWAGDNVLQLSVHFSNHADQASITRTIMTYANVAV